MSKKDKALDAVIEFAKTCPPLPKKPPTSPKPPKATKRLAWKVHHYDENKMYCEPFVQTYSEEKKKWNSGNRLSPKDMYDNQFVFPFLTPQDKHICSLIKVTGSVEDRFGYEFPDDLAYQLIGHPTLIVDNHPNERVELVKGSASFYLEKNGRNVIFKCHPPVKKLTGRDGKLRTVFVLHELGNVYKVVRLSKLELKVLRHHLELGDEYTPDGFEKLNEFLSILCGRVEMNADGLK
ncbi:MAG: hypothetical protein ACRC2T_01010 [Thermoguttaceae bacterium]